MEPSKVEEGVVRATVLVLNEIGWVGLFIRPRVVKEVPCVVSLEDDEVGKTVGDGDG
mgnify:FL=1